MKLIQIDRDEAWIEDDNGYCKLATIKIVKGVIVIEWYGGDE